MRCDFRKLDRAKEANFISIVGRRTSLVVFACQSRIDRKEALGDVGTAIKPSLDGRWLGVTVDRLLRRLSSPAVDEGDTDTRLRHLLSHSTQTAARTVALSQPIHIVMAL